MDLRTRARLAYFRARGAWRQTASAFAERQDRRFVLEPGLFAEMAAVGGDVVANCIWSHPWRRSRSSQATCPPGGPRGSIR
jgi:hypothetical protein